MEEGAYVRNARIAYMAKQEKELLRAYGALLKIAAVQIETWGIKEPEYKSSLSFDMDCLKHALKRKSL